VGGRILRNFENSLTNNCVTCQKTWICSDDEIWEVCGSGRYVAEDSGMWSRVIGWPAPDVSTGSFYLGLFDNENADITIFRSVWSTHGTAQCPTQRHLLLTIQISQYIVFYFHQLMHNERLKKKKRKRLTIHIYSWYQRKLIWYIKNNYIAATWYDVI
jgi:hypothetical protein